MSKKLLILNLIGVVIIAGIIVVPGLFRPGEVPEPHIPVMFEYETELPEESPRYYKKISPKTNGDEKENISRTRKVPPLTPLPVWETISEDDDDDPDPMPMGAPPQHWLAQVLEVLLQNMQGLLAGMVGLSQLMINWRMIKRRKANG